MAYTASAQILAHRATSAFPLSIGTALAFESLFDPIQALYDAERTVPPRVDLKQYDELWINVSTLYRNILGSVATADAQHVRPVDVLDTLVQEIDFITHHVRTTTHEQLIARFYYNHYDKLKSLHPHAKLRLDVTPKQIHYSADAQKVLDRLCKDHVKDFALKEYSATLKPEHRKRALIITHVPYDLLSAHQFERLDLLESHTGVLKTRALWHTKLLNGKELTRIPFNAAMLQVFGDHQTFHPFPMKVREEILRIADEHNWNATTTLDRLRLTIGFSKDKFLVSILQSMLNE